MTTSAPTALLAELGIAADYGTTPPLPCYAEATDLEEIGTNIMGRMQQLTPVCAVAWRDMVSAARRDKVTLLAVSGYRSIEYQAILIRRKLNSGLRIDEILRVNVAPGYSQHHTGNALDIATPGYKPLMEEFEESPAFDWLRENAAQYGFTLPYPRDNLEGLAYEPWHWCRSTA